MGGMTDDQHAEPAEPAEPVETQHEPVEVALQRSVRYGRVMISGAVLGAVLGAVMSLVFPVVDGADYELSQVVGIALVFGGVIGLALGGLLALLLGIAAKRKRGAAMAVKTDVR